MDWIKNIVNYDTMPKEGKIWVSIQNGKADYYRNHSAFVPRSRVLVFTDVNNANYFIKHWNSYLMNDYREAMPKKDFTFWVIDKCPKGYYADDIRMFKDWEPFINR